MSYQKPERWQNPAIKLFPHQVGFTCPPHDFDAAPSDLLRMSPGTVGVHGRMLHVPDYAHQLDQRKSTLACWKSLSSVWPTMAWMSARKSARTGCTPRAWGLRAFVNIARD